MQFQDVLSSENRPLCEISQVMHLAIPQDPPGKLQVNTRYSANSQWFHRTNHVGLPETDQDRYDRFAHEPWFDEQQKQKKELYKMKVRNFVRDKNAGGELVL
ncbi:hypothetical protein HDU99_001050 [Rhizoclosmatium hyalinum]|nr:hypothetical protein HDU99_001050 [Rhizoclosmatium hyalinum]